MFIASIYSQIPANRIGLNPPSLKWRQINTDKVQVIFPAGLENQGQRVANLTHYLWENHNTSVGDETGKVSILLQNQTAVSNGFVTVGPFRSEFYMTPPQFDVTTDWLDILTIHEYRHVKQFVNTQKGITNLVKNVLGSWAWGGLFATALPRWYFEGDATGMETFLTASGRGRFPAFNMQYRSIVLDNKQFGYEKAGAGSLKEFVPNWYPLGYYMVSYARQKYGEDIWAKVVNDAVRYKGLFYPFSKGLKRHAGVSTKELYNETRLELDSLWKQNVTLRSEENVAKTINSIEKSTFTQYTNPHFLNNGNLVVQKSAFNEIGTYYEIDRQGKEQKITETGVLLDGAMSTLSESNGKLCWAELAFHPRWINKTYSIIRTYDIDTKQKQKITSKSRYFSPALSLDGNKIVAISVSENLEYKIVILNANTGDIIQELPNSENVFFIHPQWTDDGKSIVIIAKQNESHELLKLDLQSGIKQTLIKPTSSALSHPFVHGNTIFLSAGFNEINNIYAIDFEDPTLYQVTNSRLGAFQPSVSSDGKQLVYSDFASDGYNIQIVDIDRSQWKKVTPNSSNDYNYVATLVKQEQGKSILDQVPNQKYPIKKFNKWSGIINPHSILPFINPPIAGASILSDNKFSTLSAQAGAFYNYNEDEWTFLGELNYAELFPIINVDFRRSNRSASYFNFSQLRDTSLVATSYSEEWAENDFSAGFNVPLNFSQGNQSTQFNFSADYHFINTTSENNFDLPSNFRDTINGDAQSITNFLNDFGRSELRSENLQALEFGLRFFSLKRLARQHLNSRLGFLINANYRTLIGSSPFEGDVLLLRGDLYLPGIGKNHSLLINTLYQQSQFLDNYKFSNRFFYPRGHDSSNSDNVFKIGVNYALPIAYPDVAFGSLAFLKRVKANFFFDYANLSTGEPFSPESLLNSQISSAGVELTFDVRFLRLLEVDFGARYSYLTQPLFNGQQQHVFDFLLISISE